MWIQIKIYLGITFIGAMGFLVSLYLAYLAGLGSFTFIGAEIGGWLAGFTAAMILTIVSKAGSRWEKCIFSLILMSMLYGAGSNLLFTVYAAGFEKAVFKVASSTEWNSLLPIAKNGSQ